MNSGDRNIMDSSKMKLARALGNLLFLDYTEVILNIRSEDIDTTPLTQQTRKEKSIINEKILYQLL